MHTSCSECFERMQSKNQVLILGISIFEKTEQTIECNCSADRVIDFYKSEKTSGLLRIQCFTSVQFYNALSILSKNEDAKSAVSTF